MASDLVAVENRLWSAADQLWANTGLKTEESEVKKVCRELLATLIREKLVLDWRETQQAKAAVLQTLKLQMRRLPPQYTKDVRSEKMARAYAHVYDHYFGAGKSAYQ